MSTVIRRKFNKITGLKNERGVWIFDREALGQMVQNFFINLFSSESRESTLRYEHPMEVGKVIPLELEAKLVAPVSDQEILSAVKDFKPRKSPGPDGLHPIFFQEQWGIIKQSVVQMVYGVFQGATFPEGVNDTLISLIPKNPNPILISQFRPISLCNTSYKIVTKILVRRMRHFLDDFFPFSVQLCSWTAHF